jgi:hypothetical protein
LKQKCKKKKNGTWLEVISSGAWATPVLVRLQRLSDQSLAATVT